ncbi:MAG: hypothetical protein ABSF85_18180 [Terriglobales bacterium]
MRKGRVVIHEEVVKRLKRAGARSAMIGPTIEWTEQATRQLDQAPDYIALSNSEEVAARITMQIVTAFDSSPHSPCRADQAGFRVLVS